MFHGKYKHLEPGGCMLSIRECRFINRLQFIANIKGNNLLNQISGQYLLNKTNSYSFNLFVAKKDLYVLLFMIKNWYIFIVTEENLQLVEF